MKRLYGARASRPLVAKCIKSGRDARAPFLAPLFLCVSLIFGFVAHADEASAIPDIAPISDAAIGAPLVVSKIQKGELSAEEAWQRGELNEETLLFLLNQEGGDKGGLNLVDKAGLSDDLVEVMIRHLPERVVKPELLKAGVRYRLGDYYFKRHDARGAEIFGKLLAAIKMQSAEGKKKESTVWFFPLVVTRLGEWHRENGHYADALNILNDALATLPQPAYAADWSLQAARSYRALGDDARARQFYQRALTYEQSRYTGLAILDEARLNSAWPLQGSGASFTTTDNWRRQRHDKGIFAEFANIRLFSRG